MTVLKQHLSKMGGQLPTILLFEEEIGKILLDRKVLRLITFDPEKEVILRWIS